MDFTISQQILGENAWEEDAEASKKLRANRGGGARGGTWAGGEGCWRRRISSRV